MTEHLQTVAGLQEKEQQLGRQLAVTNRQLTVAQEEGEADRIRLMQAEDEILSLQVKYCFYHALCPSLVFICIRLSWMPL